ncbi:plant intracellular Ras-group-related LRR 9-like [Micractinium conductrix]|uniref:Plant intracellular Ras-group-related LRR 9-like n=1 Tax=Micractinium conductrix TaxID=554055 RepID=A0A2P6VDI6_9CHLO|nr:plant intracellular Ras-group-related LRR 9-like [Micractinium conductrix]|eukprot:PSC72156.1 plant intracellular Ras-group-related LRR 9-like [Micractinium conductrix]
MAAVLAQVSPKLQLLHLGAGAPPDLLGALATGRFAGLRALDLPACNGPAAASLLPTLSQLEELTLRDGVFEGVLSLLGALPRLRLLSLTVTAPLPAGYHAHLAACRQLEEVHLYLAPMLPARFELQPAALMRLTRLRSLLISSTPGTLCGLTVGPGLAGLPALQELQVDSRVDGLPSDLCALPCLLPALRELRLARCCLAGGTLPAPLCDIASLRRLDLLHCRLASGCVHAGLPPQFSRLTNLKHLSLEGCGLCVAPPSLWRRGKGGAAEPRTQPRLRLPAGLRVEVPRALCEARQLSVLDLSGNLGLEVSLGDVQATLACLPRLALLLLGKQAACGGLGMPLAGGGAPAGAPEWRTPSVAALVALGQALPLLQIDFDRKAHEYEGIGSQARPGAA